MECKKNTSTTKPMATEDFANNGLLRILYCEQEWARGIECHNVFVLQSQSIKRAYDTKIIKIASPEIIMSFANNVVQCHRTMAYVLPGYSTIEQFGIHVSWYVGFKLLMSIGSDNHLKPNGL